MKTGISKTLANVRVFGRFKGLSTGKFSKVQPVRYYSITDGNIN